jgi:hypothetical protein
MPINGRTTYNNGGFQTDVSGMDVDPTEALKAMINAQSQQRVVSMPQQTQSHPNKYSVGMDSGSGPVMSSGRSMRYGNTPPRFNAAPLMNMDTMAGDLQKTAMQRITDRGNRMNAMIGIPSGDTQQGSYNAGPNPTDMFLAMTARDDMKNAGPGVAQKTTDARRAAGWKI